MSKRSTTSSKTNTTAAVAYYRVSTAKQGVSGLGLEAQRAAVEAHARAAGLTIGAEFVEVETGTSKRARVEIHRAIAEAKRTGAVLLIAKLDRLARNVHFISGLMESGVSFVAVDNPSVTPLTLHVLAAVAEQEAQMISARTTAALAAAKRRGVVLGKPENLTHEAQQAGAESNRARAIEANRQAACLAAKMKLSGSSLREIAEELNKAGFTTRTGARFEAMQVKRMLDRLQPADC
jgi:DNA invertase Pin-like site-specific DNA recombinase